MGNNWSLRYMDTIKKRADNESKGLYEFDKNGGNYVLKKEFHMLNKYSFPTILPPNYFN